MNGRFIRSSVIVLTLVIAGGVWASAQAPGVNVKFPFVAAGKTLSAGTYAVDVTANGNVVLTAAEGGTTVFQGEGRFAGLEVVGPAHEMVHAGRSK